MSKLLCLNLSDIARDMFFISECILIAFVAVYFYKAYKDKWTIRQASQYLLLVIVPLFSFNVAMICNVVIAFVISIFLNLLLLFSKNENLNIIPYEDEGATSIFEKYREPQMRRYRLLTDEEKEQWKKENCKNPINMTWTKAILITFIPFVISVVIRIIF